MATVDTASLGAINAAGDLSIWGLVAQADLVVQVVMIVLVISSVWCWAIIFDKVRYFRKLRQKADEFEGHFWSGGSLEELYDRIGDAPGHPLAALFVAAMREWTHTAKRGINGQDGTAQANLQSRVDRVINVALAREMEALEKIDKV